MNGLDPERKQRGRQPGTGPAAGNRAKVDLLATSTDPASSPDPPPQLSSPCLSTSGLNPSSHTYRYAACRLVYHLSDGMA
ncbi:hypothetical protein C0J52_26540 [Blattella germanica]|nr:hypothetical protein C0J52_26540 [Blattella germanica]